MAKEEAKKRMEERKAAGSSNALSTPSYAKSKTNAKDDDDIDDPIAKSLKEREKAGGLNSVVKAEKKPLTAKEKANLAKEVAKKRLEDMKSTPKSTAPASFDKS